jgi:membrane-bound ClpP family serine protease
MDWLTILGLIALGTFLVIAEIIFVPGTTLVGILGIAANTYGVYLGYETYGTTTGTIILIVTILLNILALVAALKGKSWERFSLKRTMTGKFNDDFKVEFQLGDKGKTLSSIKPIGKAVINDHEIEVRSNGGYIDENVEIEIFRIESSKIFVKPVNN